MKILLWFLILSTSIVAQDENFEHYPAPSEMIDPPPPPNEFEPEPIAPAESPQYEYQPPPEADNDYNSLPFE